MMPTEAASFNTMKILIFFLKKIKDLYAPRPFEDFNPQKKVALYAKFLNPIVSHLHLLMQGSLRT